MSPVKRKNVLRHARDYADMRSFHYLSIGSHWHTLYPVSFVLVSPKIVQQQRH